MQILACLASNKTYLRLATMIRNDPKVEVLVVCPLMLFEWRCIRVLPSGLKLDRLV